MPKKIYKLDSVDNYWHAYGFFRDPFSINDVESFFSPRPWEEHLDFLTQSIQYSNRLPLIVGEEGSGKTTFAKLLQHRVNDSAKTWRFAAEKTYDPIKFFSQIVQQFGLAAVIFPNSSIKQKISLLMDIICQTGKSYLIIIDEAQNLPSSMLEIILDLLQKQTERATNLHVILLGTPELEPQVFKVAQYKICEGLLHTIKLKPFTSEETEAYVRHCFSESGRQMESPLTTVNFDTLYKETHGYVKKINALAREFLRRGTNYKEESQVSFLQQHQVKMVAGVSLALVLGLSTIVYNHLNNSSTGKLTQSQTKSPVIAAQEITFDSNESAKIQNQKSSQTQKVVQTQINTSEPKKSLNQVATPVSWNDIFIDAKLDASVISQMATPRVSLQSTIVPLLVSQSVLQQTFESEKLLSSGASTEAAVTDEQSNFVNANIDLEPTLKQKLLSMDGQSLTIQLMASEDEESIQQFMQAHPLEGQFYYYQTMRGNKPWYILIFGTYPSKQEAYATLKRLPEDVKTFHPWLRLYSSVQGDIKA
ncbi:MAG: AAA family ATPase [Proteobacteria bacterium]|nr:AAA family ATPase [Pseudomonadota bacterium]